VDGKMANKPMIKEVFVLRSLACLSIVFLHAIGQGLEVLAAGEEINQFTFMLYDSLHLFLYFGTPMFVFISELLLARSYKDRQLPNYFLSKRVKFIFIPFVVMAFFYSIPYAASLESWGLKFLLNVFIGSYHGYFVLIIFQFYLAHLFFHRYLKKWKPTIVLPVAFLINLIYLAIFNFTSPPAIPYGEYIWTRYYWVPFLGWIFYFCLGFYCGQHYEKMIKFLNNNKSIVFAAPLLTTTLLLFLYYSGLINVHSSKRIDILLHTPAIGFFLIYVVQQWRRIPKLLIVISQYSFGIYLLHIFYLSLAREMYDLFSLTFGASYIIITFLFSVICSIFTVYYLNQWKYGEYVVGKIGVRYNNEKVPQPDPVYLIKKAYHRLTA
jgi:membrane-bound acyltransferase YfiQ involved in biofilm formation